MLSSLTKNAHRSTNHRPSSGLTKSLYLTIYMNRDHLLVLPTNRRHTNNSSLKSIQYAYIPLTECFPATGKGELSVWLDPIPKIASNSQFLVYPHSFYYYHHGYWVARPKISKVGASVLDPVAIGQDTSQTQYGGLSLRRPKHRSSLPDVIPLVLVKYVIILDFFQDPQGLIGP